MAGRVVLLLLLVGAVVQLASAVIVHSFDGIIKSPQDKCSYRIITLDNQLQALLIHEPDADKASAALDVNVGSFADPDDIAGLAHFLEHLLFMGTAKYPEENDYSKYLNEHGGFSNAFTADKNTNYFFEVSHEHLHGALDRFAQFFIAPLFNPGGTEREMQAVDSEYKMGLRDDGRRAYRVRQVTANPAHPSAKFGCGNLETLGGRPDIRDRLLAFHEQYYSANIMKLAVYGRESLDQLALWVEQLFSVVPDKQVAPPQWRGIPIWSGAPVAVYAKTLMDVAQLTVNWRVPEQQHLLRSKPYEYVTHLLGHESAGSLLALLKSRNWATGLGAHCDIFDDDPTFSVSASLTDEGRLHYQEVVRLVFAYINMLRGRDVEQWIWEEGKQLADIGFKWAEKHSSSSRASNLAGDMHLFSPEHILDGGTTMDSFDAAAIRAILDSLTADNFRLMLAAKDFGGLSGLGDLSVEWQVEKWYSVEYAVQRLTEKTVRSLAEAGGMDELFLPAPNRYIPSDFEVVIKEPSANPLREPKQVLPTLWHKLDDTFTTPKASVVILFRRAACATDLVGMYLSLVLDEKTYDALTAGLACSLGMPEDGIELGVSGFHDKLLALLEFILNELLVVQFEASKVDVVKQHGKKNLSNWSLKSPRAHAAVHADRLTRESIWTVEDHLAVIDDVTIADLQEAWSALLHNSRPEILVHGNLTEERAIEVHEMVRRILNPVHPHPALLQPVRTVKTPLGAVVFVPRPLPDPNAAIVVQLSINDDYLDRVLAALFVQVFNESFFDILRTKEQLGYATHMHLRTRQGVAFVQFLIQSAKDPIFLDERIESFLEGHARQVLMRELSDKDFAHHKQALHTEWTAKKRGIYEETHDYWGQIGCQRFRFDRVRSYVELLDKVTLLDLQFFADRFIWQRAPERRKLAVHVWPELAKRADVGYQDYDGVLIDDPLAFISRCELFPSV